MLVRWRRRWRGTSSLFEHDLHALPRCRKGRGREARLAGCAGGRYAWFWTPGDVVRTTCNLPCHSKRCACARPCCGLFTPCLPFAVGPCLLVAHVSCQLVCVRRWSTCCSKQVGVLCHAVDCGPCALTPAPPPFVCLCRCVHARWSAPGDI